MPGPSLVDQCQAQVAAQSDAEGHYYPSDGVVVQFFSVVMIILGVKLPGIVTQL
jgi:hypothetical protein